MFERSGDTSLLVNVLRDKLKQVGMKVTYEDLSAHIHADVRKKAYGALLSARKIVEREDNIFTVCEPKIGILRVSDEAAVKDIAAGRVKRAKKHARSGMKTLSRVSTSNLSEEMRLRFFGTWACLQVMDQIGRESSQKKIANACNDAPMSFEKTVKLFARE